MHVPFTAPYYSIRSGYQVNQLPLHPRWGLGPLPLALFFFSAFSLLLFFFFPLSLSQRHWVLLHHSIFLEIPPNPLSPFHLHFHTHPSEWFNRMFRLYAAFHGLSVTDSC